MDRAINQSLSNQLGVAANYAAQSGINDAIAYLKTNPTAAADNCNDLIAAGQPLEDSSDIADNRSTSYNCVLIDSTPSELAYQQLPPNKSQVIKLTANSVINGKILFAWQASDRNKDEFPNNLGSGLQDETTWGNNNYGPILRLTLYPVPASGAITNVQADSRTYFLYPASQNGSITSINYSSTPDGTITETRCGNNTPFASSDSSLGPREYQCNIVIDVSAAPTAALIIFMHG